MYICPKCQADMDLPVCGRCHYEVECKESIWQFSDMPDMVIGGDGDQYIGYEHIGETYSGRRKYLVEEKDALVAGEISGLTGGGVFLDLACGDGCLTVPCAALGVRVIAGDISNKMLTVLMDRAKHRRVSLENVTICRMNALHIPLADESADCIVANGVLHLVSDPPKVLGEIYRVLKTGGVFVCLDDAPGKSADLECENTEYHKIVNYIYSEYWAGMKKRGLRPLKYSWWFDRNAFCGELFASHFNKTIPRGNAYTVSLKDEFLPRFLNRGFSDQTAVPKDAHEEMTAELLADCQRRFGENFADTVFHGVERDIWRTIYRK